MNTAHHEYRLSTSERSEVAAHANAATPDPHHQRRPNPWPHRPPRPRPAISERQQGLPPRSAAQPVPRPRATGRAVEASACARSPSSQVEGRTTRTNRNAPTTTNNRHAAWTATCRGAQVCRSASFVGSTSFTRPRPNARLPVLTAGSTAITSRLPATSASWPRRVLLSPPSHCRAISSGSAPRSAPLQRPTQQRLLFNQPGVPGPQHDGLHGDGTAQTLIDRSGVMVVRLRVRRCGWSQTRLG
jgi:hypothetical protein